MLDDLTRTDVLTAARETTVGEVTAAMRRRNADLVCVLDEQHPLGLLSPADIGRAFIDGDALAERAVGDLVDDPVTVRRRTTREGLLSTMRETGADRIVVVDDDDQFVGVVTLHDLLAAYGSEFEAVLELL